jgi:hypothetical protein
MIYNVANLTIRASRLFIVQLQENGSNSKDEGQYD